MGSCLEGYWHMVFGRDLDRQRDLIQMWQIITFTSCCPRFLEVSFLQSHWHCEFDRNDQTPEGRR